MAAFQRLFRASLAPTAAIGAAVYATGATASADAGAAPLVSELIVNPGRTVRGDKLPIYSNPDDEEIVTLVVSHNPLTEHIATAREATAGVVGQAREVVEKGVSRWIDFERGVEREVKQVLPKDESLTPGIIYVLVAGLTGSVLTRTRSFPIRFLAPPTFALIAMPYFLPKTSHNLRAYLSDLEDKHAPEFAAKHDQFNANLELHWQLIKDRLHGAGHEARQWSDKAAQGVESATGLRVSDAARRGRQDIQEVRSGVADAVASLRAKVDEGAPPPAPVAPVRYEKVATVFEEKPVAEIVVPVTPGAPVPVDSVSAPVPVPVAEPKVVPTPAASPAVVVAAAPVAAAPPAAAPPAAAPAAAPAAPVAAPVREVREVDAPSVKPKPKPTERIV